MGTSTRCALAAALAFACACSEGEVSSTDSGSAADAGTTGEDSGVPADRDAGAPDDDAGMADAGPTMLDAGSPGSIGCTSGAGLDEGETTFMLDGMTRRYVLHLPNGYTQDRAWPLIFALHGNGGSIDYWNGTSGSRDIRGAVEDGAILVIAEAIDGRWRDYDADPSTWPGRIELELAYFDELVERLTTDLCVDESEIFSMGFSGGGSFSGVLGCRREYIRAIAVGGSVIYFDEADCVSAPAAWITIGTEELVPAREAFRDWFRDAGMCETTSMDTEPSPCVAYDGCAPETPVHYCQHPAGHVWPDFGTAAAWSFFQRFVTP